MPEVMVALDLKSYWERHSYLLIERLKNAGCTHYKVHKPLPTLDLRATARHLHKACLPSTSATSMIDIKKHDIWTETVRDVEEHLDMGFTFVTVHAMAGRKVLTELRKAGLAKRVVAVTALTGASDADMLEMHSKNRAEMELLLGRIAFDCGIEGGLVCSAPGIPALKKFVKGIPFMTPALYVGHKSKDQEAVATPIEAARFGSDMLIGGRIFLGTEERPRRHPEVRFKYVSDRVKETRLTI